MRMASASSPSFAMMLMLATLLALRSFRDADTNEAAAHLETVLSVEAELVPDLSRRLAARATRPLALAEI